MDAEQASAAKPVVEQQQEVAKSVPAMMLPRAVALAKATALPLPASPLNATPGEAPARASGNAQVSKGWATNAGLCPDILCQTFRIVQRV